MNDQPDLRLVQLSRILGQLDRYLSASQASAAIVADPARFASVLFDEAAQNDDVTSSAAALDYLEARLAFFGDLVAPAEDSIRAEFRSRLAAWDSPVAP